MKHAEVARPLRVGVTGHRLHRLGNIDLAGLAECAGAVLRVLEADAPAQGAARPRLVCNLADGADGIVAQAALSRHWPLDAILPFPAAAYRQDFVQPAALAAFDRQLATAASLVELPACADDAEARAEAYETAGRMMLAQSDVLIGIWDGTPARGRGGTAQIIAEAVALTVPVIVIEPSGGRGPVLFRHDPASHESIPQLAGFPQIILSQPIQPILLDKALASFENNGGG